MAREIHELLGEPGLAEELCIVEFKVRRGSTHLTWEMLPAFMRQERISAMQAVLKHIEKKVSE